MKKRMLVDSGHDKCQKEIAWLLRQQNALFVERRAYLQENE